MPDTILKLGEEIDTGTMLSTNNTEGAGAGSGSGANYGTENTDQVEQEWRRAHTDLLNSQSDSDVAELNSLRRQLSAARGQLTVAQRQIDQAQIEINSAVSSSDITIAQLRMRAAEGRMLTATAQHELMQFRFNAQAARLAAASPGAYGRNL